MPLKKGSSKKTISSNIEEMMKSDTFGKGKSQKKRGQMAAAAAYRMAGKSRNKKGGKPRGGSAVERVSTKVRKYA